MRPCHGGGEGMDARSGGLWADIVVFFCLVAGLGLVGQLEVATRAGVAVGLPLADGYVVAEAPVLKPLAAPVAAEVAVPLPVEPVVERPVDPVLRAQYEAVQPKSALELQQFRQSQTVGVRDAAGRTGIAALTSINPRVNAWHLLAFDWGGGRPREYYHIENPVRRAQVLKLSDADGGALLVGVSGAFERCDLWSGPKPALALARASKLPYAPLCGGRVFLRNQVEGYSTDLEQMTDFLRDTVWKGDDIVGFVREAVYQDAFRESGKTERAAAPAGPVVDGLPDARLRPQARGVAVVPEGLGLGVAGDGCGRMQMGRWYGVPGGPGIHASVMRAGDVAPEIFERNKAHLSPLDAVEASALAYFVAFDLDVHEMRFAAGTDHPRLNWSARVPPSSRHEGLPGPDGVGSPAPLVTTGMVGPTAPGQVAAAFAGGFKREHGGFKWGELSQRNFGSHYGFIEGGAVLSKLQPGLSTLYTLDDGSFGMKTWTVQDDAMLERVAYARQNGVPLVEEGPDGEPMVASLVNRWGPGNWSGSVDAKQRTLRGGACLLQAGQKQHLVYAYFSTATPSAMAVTFSALGCRHALNLDMNAPEHTYMALYARKGDQMEVRHLVRAMASVDRNIKGRLVPRFIAYPDNRDLFYMVRKGGAP